MSFNIKHALALSAALVIMLASCSDNSGINTESGGFDITLTNSIEITEAGTYTLRGSLDDGQITVNAPDKKVELILVGVDVTSVNSAPLYIKAADTVTVKLMPGCENILSNTGGYTAVDDNNIDAVIFSKADLVFGKMDGGTGGLTITAAEGNGITSKDTLSINDGIYEISVGNHALEANDNIEINYGEFLISAGKDGIHAENSDDMSLGNIIINGGRFNIESESDGIDAGGAVTVCGGEYIISAKGKGVAATGSLTVDQGNFVIDSTDDALHSNSDITVNEGVYVITSGDDGIHADNGLILNGGNISILDSYEGLEGHTVLINGGDITVTSGDDGINAAGGNDGSGFGGMKGGDKFGADSEAYITINGGIVRVNANGDGVDSNGALNVNGGELYIDGPQNGGNGALDYGTEAVVTGGTVIATGSSQMAAGFGADSTQCTALISFGQNVNGELLLSDKDGNEIICFTPTKSYSCAVISCAAFTVGDTYTVTAGGNILEHTQSETVMGGAFNGFGGFGGGRGGKGERTEGGFMRPDGVETPEGGFMRPDGVETPEGGFTRPEGMEIPEGAVMPPRVQGRKQNGEFDNRNNDNETSADNSAKE